ncbi:MAG: sulfotransferase [Verrucomicrobiota bacterium]
MTESDKLQRARALWQAHHFEESCRLFAEAADDPAASAEALTDAARALGHRYEITRAEGYLARLGSLPGNSRDRALLTAQTLRMIHREEQAIALLTESLKVRAHGSAPAWLELAVLLERRHRAAEASEAVEAALKLSPNLMEGLIIKARLCRRSGEDSRAESLLRRVTRHAAAHPFTRAQAWAALASLADAAGDYAGAVARMEECKKILRPLAGQAEQHSRTVLGHLEKMGRELTAEDFRRWQGGVPETPARVAQLTGFPRSGTTLLENILDAHPDLMASEEREVFSRDILSRLWREPDAPVPPSIAAFDAIPPEKRRRLRADYLQAMEEAAGEPLGGRLHLDKNPTHTLFIPAIVRLFPETKFLIALRDPRDVIVSCWMQFLPLNPSSVSYLSWETAARRYELDFSLWRQWREQLAAESWLEVRYEDVVADMERGARRALDFLGLPWDPALLSYRARLSGKTVHSPTYLDVAKPIHAQAVGRWKNYLPWLEPQLERLRPFVEAFGY